MAAWRFLTNHAEVLLCIADDPGMRLREIADSVGITERAAQRIVGELDEDGFISKERNGRRNNYILKSDLRLSHPLMRDQTIGELLAVVSSNGGVEGSRKGR